MTAPKGPITIELDDLPPASPDIAPEIFDTPEDNIPATTAPRPIARRGGRVLRWLFGAFSGFIAIALGLWAWDFVTGLIARFPMLGWIAAGLGGLAFLLTLILAIRELAALSRLGRIDRLRHDATLARASNDLGAARKVVDRLTGLYAGRANTAWGAARLAETYKDQLDGDALIDDAERLLLAEIDKRALAEVETAAARVATVTALVPLALADVAAALIANLMMIRRIAEVYGGRSGTLGAWRLTRAVVAHLAATGAVAIGDDLISSALGGGVLSKLSRRFGEGLINGALTARVGVAAIELCRPLPFHASARPSVSTVVRRALTGLFTREKP